MIGSARCGGRETGGRSPALRPGATLVELILVSVLFSSVLAGLATFAASQGRLGRMTADRVRAGELTRTVHLVLSREIRYLAPGDHSVVDPLHSRLRAVRGSGVICSASGRSLVVGYRGVRRPEPTKDSVLLVSTGGGTEALALEGAWSDGACANGMRLDLSATPGALQGMVMVFEPGEYHLTGGALRYRRGRAGRQPLTEAVLNGGSIQALTPAGGGLRILLSLDPDSLRSSDGRDVRLSIHQPGAAPPAVSRVP